MRATVCLLVVLLLESACATLGPARGEPARRAASPLEGRWRGTGLMVDRLHYELCPDGRVKSLVFGVEGVGYWGVASDDEGLILDVASPREQTTAHVEWRAELLDGGRLRLHTRTDRRATGPEDPTLRWETQTLEREPGPASCDDLAIAPSPEVRITVCAAEGAPCVVEEAPMRAGDRVTTPDGAAFVLLRVFSDYGGFGPAARLRRLGPGADGAWLTVFQRHPEVEKARAGRYRVRLQGVPDPGPSGRPPMGGGRTDEQVARMSAALEAWMERPDAKPATLEALRALDEASRAELVETWGSVVKKEAGRGRAARRTILARFLFQEHRFVAAATMARAVLDEKARVPLARNLLARALFFLGNEDATLAELKLRRRELEALETGRPLTPDEENELLDALFLHGAAVLERPERFERAFLEGGREAWLKYLAYAPQSPQRAEVEQRLMEIDARLSRLAGRR